MAEDKKEKVPKPQEGTLGNEIERTDPEFEGANREAAEPDRAELGYPSSAELAGRGDDLNAEAPEEEKTADGEVTVNLDHNVQQGRPDVVSGEPASPQEQALGVKVSQSGAEGAPAPAKDPKAAEAQFKKV